MEKKLKTYRNLQNNREYVYYDKILGKGIIKFYFIKALLETCTNVMRKTIKIYYML